MINLKVKLEEETRQLAATHEMQNFSTAQVMDGGMVMNPSSAQS